MLALHFSGSVSSPFSLTLGFRSEVSCGKNMMGEKLPTSWHQASKARKGDWEGAGKKIREGEKI